MSLHRYRIKLQVTRSTFSRVLSLPMLGDIIVIALYLCVPVNPNRIPSAQVGVTEVFSVGRGLLALSHQVCEGKDRFKQETDILLNRMMMEMLRQLCHRYTEHLLLHQTLRLKKNYSYPLRNANVCGEQLNKFCVPYFQLFITFPNKVFWGKLLRCLQHLQSCF